MATENTDILLDENEDLLIKDGDIVIGPSDDQHLRHLLMGDKGSFRNVTIGFGAVRFVKSTGNEIKFKRDLKEALDQDGYVLETLENVNGKLKVKAERK